MSGHLRPETMDMIQAEAVARLEAKASEVLRLQLLCSVLVEALRETRQLVSACASDGFTSDDNIIALFINNGAITRALAQADPTGLSLSGRG